MRSPTCLPDGQLVGILSTIPRDGGKQRLLAIAPVFSAYLDIRNWAGENPSVGSWGRRVYKKLSSEPTCLLPARLCLAAPCPVLICFSACASVGLRALVEVQLCSSFLPRWSPSFPKLSLPSSNPSWNFFQRQRSLVRKYQPCLHRAHRDPAGSWWPTLRITGYRQGMGRHTSM